MKYSTCSMLLIVVAGLILRLAFACLTPAWQSPDEYAHYWYAEQIAESGNLPYSEPVLPKYESYQPPLYYLLTSVLLRVNPIVQPFTTVSEEPSSQLITVRLFSVVLSLLTLLVLMSWLRRLCWLTDSERCGALAFAALLPTYVGVSSSLNNDVLVILLGTLAISSTYAWEGANVRSSALAGWWAGLALLAKFSAILLLPALAIYMLASSREHSARGRSLLALLVSWLPGALMLGTFNLWQYGQLLAVNPGVTRDWDLAVPHILQAVRNFAGSFVIAFGRTYNLKPSFTIYLVLGLPLLVLAAYGWWRTVPRYPRAAVITLAPLALAIGLSLTYTLAYPAAVMTSWGKNIYPLLPLCAIAAAVGWHRCSQRLGKTVSALAIAVLISGCCWGLVRLAAG